MRKKLEDATGFEDREWAGNVGSFQTLEKARKGIFPKCLQQAALPSS